MSAWLTGLLLLLPGSTQQGVNVTFLANEGVLLEGGGRRVLIDALYQRYRNYALPADSTRAALAAARPPYNADLVLVTHWHGDHFHPEQVAAHLRANPRAHLLTSTQVIDSLAGRVPATDPLRARITGVVVPRGEQRTQSVAGILVRVLGITHHDLRHVGYIVELGGRRVLHLGDTDVVASDYAALRLDTARIDLALIPSWMLTSAEGRDIIARHIRPRHMAAIHVGTGEGARVEQEVARVLPDAHVFHRSLETRRWNGW